MGEISLRDTESRQHEINCLDFFDRFYRMSVGHFRMLTSAICGQTHPPGELVSPLRNAYRLSEA